MESRPGIPAAVRARVVLRAPPMTPESPVSTLVAEPSDAWLLGHGDGVSMVPAWAMPAHVDDASSASAMRPERILLIMSKLSQFSAPIPGAAARPCATRFKCAADSAPGQRRRAWREQLLLSSAPRWQGGKDRKSGRGLRERRTAAPDAS